MKRSTERILTTHTGSLPRPPDVFDLLQAGDASSRAALKSRAPSAVAEVVRQQVDAGVDIVSDGEQAKPGFYVYVRDRLKGLEGVDPAPQPFINPDFPGYNAWREARGNKGGGPPGNRPVCIGPLGWKDRASLDADIANLKSGLQGVEVAEAFLPSASAALVAQRIENRYYPSYDAYLAALVDVMQVEYRAIVDAGLLLQIDAPEMALEPALPQFRDRPLAEFKKALAQWVEALNAALAGIPEERVRFHVCWGNNEAPHTRDVALHEIVDMVLQVRAGAYLIEAANPRHAHEWQVWQDVRLPEGKILIPGVIDSTTNFVEHPQLVAERIQRFASVVGKENVIAGTDCGFGTWAITDMIYPPVVWAKLKALADGARLASQVLWDEKSKVTVAGSA